MLSTQGIKSAVDYFWYEHHTVSFVVVPRFLCDWAELWATASAFKSASPALRRVSKHVGLLRLAVLLEVAGLLASYTEVAMVMH